MRASGSRARGPTRIGLWRCGRPRPLILTGSCRPAVDSERVCADVQLGAGEASWSSMTFAGRGAAAHPVTRATLVDVGSGRRWSWPPLTGVTTVAHTRRHVFASIQVVGEPFRIRIGRP